MIELRKAIRADYARLYRVLGAVKALGDERHALAGGGEAVLRRRANGLIRREIRGAKGAGVLKKRFLNALSPAGTVTLWDTVGAAADRVIELRDTFGQADTMLAPILAAALEAGQEAVACYDLCAPYTRLAHLILPGLRLAFVSATPKDPYPAEPYRRVRLDATVPQEALAGRRQRLRFLKKAEDELKEDACGLHAGIVEKHSRLEELYNPHVDFAGLRALADAYAEKILTDWGGKG